MIITDNRKGFKTNAEVGDIVVTDSGDHYLVISKTEYGRNGTAMRAHRLLDLSELSTFCIGEVNESIEVGYKFERNKEQIITEIIGRDNLEITIK